MGKEQENVDLTGKRVTGIFIDLEGKSVLLTAKDQTLAMLRLAPEGLIFHAATHVPAEEVRDVPALLPGAEAAQRQPAETERTKAVTLQGKLKSKPKEGRPDSRGNPTAWARLAVHEDDRDGAHLYSATFHKHTAKIALSLERDAPLTVQGYPHENDHPGSRRMDTLSVINLLDYPGKPESK
jgi:hypothetical protein